MSDPGATEKIAVEVDINDLRVQLASAKSEFKSFLSALADADRVAQQYGESLSTSTNPTLAILKENAAQASLQVSSLTFQLKAAQSAASSVKGGAEEAAGGFSNLRLNTAGATREIIVLAHEMLVGNFSRVPGSVMVLTERMGGLTLGFLGTFGAAAGFLALLGYIEYEAIKLENELTRLGTAEELTGNSSYVATEIMRQQYDLLNSMSGVSKKAAEGLLEVEAAEGRLSLSMVNQINQLLPEFVAAYGDKGPAALEKFTAQISNLTLHGFEELDRSTLKLQPSMYEFIANLIKTGQSAQAAQLIIQEMAERGGISLISLKQRSLDVAQQIENTNGEIQDQIGRVDADQSTITGLNIKLAQLVELQRQLNAAIAAAPRNAALDQYKTDLDFLDTIHTKYGERLRLDRELAQAERALSEAQGLHDDVGIKKSTAAITELADQIKHLDDVTAKHNETLLRASGVDALANTRLAIQQVLVDQSLTDQQRYDQVKALWNKLIAGERATSLQITNFKREEAAQLGTLQKKIDSDADRLSKEQTSSRLADIKSQTDTEIKAIEQRHSFLEITAEEELTQLQEVENRRYQAVLAELSAEQKEEQNNATALQRINKQIEDNYRQHTARMAEINRVGTAQLVADYEKAWAPVTSGFNSMVSSLLSGNQTILGALRVGLGTFLSDAITTDVKRLEHWIFTDAAMTTANAAGNAARSTSDAAASHLSFLTRAREAIASIETDAAKTYASVFAWAAPELGPFAAVPAAAATALVIGAEALIPSLDVGTGAVPNDTLANVHKGEVVMPAFQSEQFRGLMDLVSSGALSGGGGGSTLNISAVDSKSILDLAHANPEVFAKIVARVWQNNRSSRPEFLR